MSSEQQRPEDSLSRREALKAAAALGTAVAASSLVPSRWSKPKIGVGALPAHAQGTTEPPPPGAELSCNVTAYVGPPIQLDPTAPITSRSMVALQASIDPPSEGVELCVNLQIIAPDDSVAATFNDCALTDADGNVSIDYTIKVVNDPGYHLVVTWTLDGDDPDSCSTDDEILHLLG